MEIQVTIRVNDLDSAVSRRYEYEQQDWNEEVENLVRILYENNTKEN